MEQLQAESFWPGRKLNLRKVYGQPCNFASRECALQVIIVLVALENSCRLGIIANILRRSQQRNFGMFGQDELIGLSGMQHQVQQKDAIFGRRMNRLCRVPMSQLQEHVSFLRMRKDLMRTKNSWHICYAWSVLTLPSA